ncbi:MAG: hypothetical protein J1E63_02810 [Muribaculaceae bacterium]|nr:hypothetical protein [Muribaculaceae bacterium]
MKTICYITHLICYILVGFVIVGCNSNKQREEAQKEVELKFHPQKVVMPNDKSDLFAEIGFEYSTIEEAEKKIVEKLDSIYATEDGLYIHRMYNDELRLLVKNDPATLTYDFPLMKERGYVDIHKSEDGLVKLYDWDTHDGGTMIAWGCLLQFASNDGVYVYECGINELDYASWEEGEMGCAVAGLYSLQADNGETYYLAHTYVRQAGNWAYAQMKAFRINDNRLEYVSIFDEGPNEWSGNCTAREYTIADWYFKTYMGEGWDWLYRFNPQTNILYVPELIDDELTDRYNLYKFNGKRFDYIGDDGGYWLHPSIRDFSQIAMLFCTTNYRVRIDEMHNDTYRYASWKNGQSMNEQPDLIIYNGLYNEDKKAIVFENNGYMYLVDGPDEAQLSVVKDGKTILHEKMVARKF